MQRLLICVVAVVLSAERSFQHEGELCHKIQVFILNIMVTFPNGKKVVLVTKVSII